MSGPAIHYLVGKKLPAFLHQELGSAVLSQVDGLQEHGPYTALGTQGPDFLFFHTGDWNPTLHKIVSVYMDVSDFIAKLKRDIMELVPDELIAMKEALDAAVEGTVEHSSLLTEIEQTVGDLRGAMSALLAVIKVKVEEHITGAVDLFSLMEHPIQAGHPLDEWWWFDTLHYRRTGDFARELLAATEIDPGSPEHAYALGYLSHVGADVVGHPFVNLIAGGPYRLQPQRHKLAENFQDAWAYRYYVGGEFVSSRLHEKFDFGDPDGHLPASLRKLICDSVNRVYGNNFGPPMTAGDIDKAYRLWYKWFRNSTETGTLPPPTPYSLTGEIQEVWEQFTENVDEIGDMIENAYDAGGGGFWGFLFALAAAIVGAVLLVVAIIDFIAGSIATIGLAPFRFMISLAYEALYNAYENYRLGVALNGFAFPLDKHLDFDYAQHLIDPRVPDGLGHHPTPYSFPRKRWNGYGAESHLFVPQSAIETYKTTPAPLTYARNKVSYYVDGKIQYENGILGWLDQIDEARLDDLHARMWKESLGNAPRMTTELYRAFRNREAFPNFSLDGDRGMAYRCWRVSGGGPVTEPVKPEFI